MTTVVVGNAGRRRDERVTLVSVRGRDLTGITVNRREDLGGEGWRHAAIVLGE